MIPRRPLTLLFLAAAALALPAAVARPTYRLQAIKQLHFEGSALSKKTMACTYCHVKDTGGPPWNAFGEELKAGFRAGPQAKFPQVLYEVLAANKDADADGYEDAIEVFARTLPGDPASKPAEEATSLAERFQAAGGVALYKP